MAGYIMNKTGGADEPIRPVCYPVIIVGEIQ
jgi:hypothetical protein